MQEHPEFTVSLPKTSNTLTTSSALSSSPRNANPSPTSPHLSSARVGHPTSISPPFLIPKASCGLLPSPTKRIVRKVGLQNKFGDTQNMTFRDSEGRKGILGKYTLSPLL